MDIDIFYAYKVTMTLFKRLIWEFSDKVWNLPFFEHGPTNKETNYLNDPSAINITMCVCRTLHILSVKIFVAFIGCLLLILCLAHSKNFFCCLVTFTAAAAEQPSPRLKSRNQKNPVHARSTNASVESLGITKGYYQWLKYSNSAVSHKIIDRR